MSNRDVVIFGAGGFAGLTWYCLTHDSQLRVCAFTVDAGYLDATRYMGLPVVAFENLECAYPPATVRLIIPMGYRGINALRRDRYESAKRRGYGFVSYVSSRASVWPDLSIGENSLVFEHALIQPFASVGDNAIVCCGAIVSHHCRIGNHSFVSGGATLAGSVQVEEQAFIGTGAVLRDGVRVAPRSFIGAGAIVVADTESDEVYVGNPARSTGALAADAL